MASVTTAPTETDIGPVEAFEEGVIRIVAIDAESIGVLRWRNDTFYAVRNKCPHQGAPLCEGAVGPMVVVKEPENAGGFEGGAIDVDHERPVITCAWHHWEFDARTGRSLCDPTLRARTYKVEAREGRVYLASRRNVARREKG